MKYALCPALVAICALAAFTPVAKAVDGRAAYGDEKTDFYLATVPAGEKYERRYLYFGVWSNFYRVNSDSGECSWSVAKSSWVCPDKTIRCGPKRCRPS
jgi:hypothetical protein